MKPQEYKSGDLLVCLKDCKDYGPDKRAFKDYFYMCHGVYSPDTSHKGMWTCGLIGYDFIFTRNNFRKATEEETKLYQNGAKSIIIEYSIFN